MDCKYNKIFWLEDYPEFLPRILEIAEEQKPGFLTTRNLLSRISFASNLGDALKITSSTQFDLYITDGDFPNSPEPEHSKELISKLSEFLETGERFDIDSNSGSITYNFVNFYKQFLEKNNSSKAVVFSANIGNACLAYNLDLPFYGKGSILPSLIKTYVLAHNALFMPKWIRRKQIPTIPMRDSCEIDSWECGNTRDLVAKYLL